MNYKQTYEAWKSELKAADLQTELQRIETDDKLLEESFYKFLEFGTAGMRGTLALGTNRMNTFTVRRATQGLADYLNKTGAQGGVVIAYDSRRFSAEFALDAALVLAKNGIKAMLYDSLHSVPQLSFSILELKCAAGIVITASHNPPEYNGYKVYGSDGAQLGVEDAAAVTLAIDEVKNYLSITPMDEKEAIAKGLLQYLGSEMDERYYSKVRGVVIDREAVKAQAKSLNVVYTPLFGTGAIPVRHLLTDMGVNLCIVSEQEQPNSDFPGLSAPNPESREVFELAFKLANKVNADMIIATDPDCDRLGLAVRNKLGEFEILTGNQIGCLLLHYVLTARKATGFKGDEFAVKSVVSTIMADEIARRFGVELRDVLTGFRFIGEQIKLAEISGKGTFVFGFEESYGYLGGTFVRDKDAAMAAVMVIEVACHYAAKGMTLYDAMKSIYETYGYFEESVLSLGLSGMEGLAKISGAVQYMREHTLSEIGGFTVISAADFETDVKTVLSTGKTSKVGLPKSNVLLYELEGGRLILRPSGTEPKLKAYCSVHADTAKTAKDMLARLVAATQTLMQDLTKS